MEVLSSSQGCSKMHWHRAIQLNVLHKVKKLYFHASFSCLKAFTWQPHCLQISITMGVLELLILREYYSTIISKPDPRITHRITVVFSTLSLPLWTIHQRHSFKSSASAKQRDTKHKAVFGEKKCSCLDNLPAFSFCVQSGFVGITRKWDLQI